MLDSTLAKLYGVKTGRLNEAVKRNSGRFPPDFMFKLTHDEFENLMSQFAISSFAHGGRRKLPLVFTEQGVAMFSGVLHSPKAVAANVQIMRAFVAIRRMISGHDALRLAIEGLERRTGRNERDIHMALNYLKEILFPPIKEIPEKPRSMGLVQEKQHR